MWRNIQFLSILDYVTMSSWFLRKVCICTSQIENSTCQTLEVIEYQWLCDIHTCIRIFVSSSVFTTIVHAIICERMDSYNSLFAGLPKTRLFSLQSLMNSAVRLIALLPGYSNFSIDMTDVLHWLRVASRVQYKVLLLSERAQQGLASKISLRPIMSKRSDFF